MEKSGQMSSDQLVEARLCEPCKPDHIGFDSVSDGEGFPGGSDGKETVCNAGDLGFTPGLGRSLGEGNGTHFSILAWRSPWTEEPGGLQSMELQRVRRD